MLGGSGTSAFLSSRRDHREAQPSTVVASLLDGLRPTAIEQVPARRDAQAHFEADAAGPSEFPLDSRTINCVAPIVARPVGHQRDQVPVGLASGWRAKRYCARRASVLRVRCRLRSLPRG